MIFLGLNNACSIHEWNMNFRGENVHFMMTSVCGHVMSLDFVGKFNNWDRVDPVIKSICNKSIFILKFFHYLQAELFHCPTEKKEAVAKLKMPAFLAKEAKGCDYLVLWLDCDKEGENICFEVMDAVRESMRITDHVS